MIVEVDEVVLFIDEVEEFAAARDGRPVTHAVTNELLQLIPVFRERPRHLLVCATNAIHRLDTAFIRPGRFDYLLPVGPPDEAARGVRRHAHRVRLKPDAARATVDDFLRAIADTRPTLTSAIVHEFETDIDTYARM